VNFVGGCHRTIIVAKSVSPMWDQTLVFEVTLFGNTDDPKVLWKEINPRVVVELYDKDMIGLTPPFSLLFVVCLFACLLACLLV